MSTPPPARMKSSPAVPLMVSVPSSEMISVADHAGRSREHGLGGALVVGVGHGHAQAACRPAPAPVRRVDAVAPAILVQVAPINSCHWKVKTTAGSMPSRSMMLAVDTLSASPSVGVASLMTGAPVGSVVDVDDRCGRRREHRLDHAVGIHVGRLHADQQADLFVAGREGRSGCSHIIAEVVQRAGCRQRCPKADPLPSATRS